MSSREVAGGEPILCLNAGKGSGACRLFNFVGKKHQTPRIGAAEQFISDDEYSGFTIVRGICRLDGMQAQVIEIAKDECIDPLHDLYPFIDAAARKARTLERFA